jgi:hypothetical protein
MPFFIFIGFPGTPGSTGPKGEPAIGYAGAPGEKVFECTHL